ncbi:MAG: FkbM family methyltransferase [Thermoanaerobaculia bacterium]
MNISMIHRFARRIRNLFNLQVLRRFKRPLELEYLRRLAKRSGAELVCRTGNIAVCRGVNEIRISPKNHVYAQDLIRNFDYYFDVVVPLRENGRLVVDYSAPTRHTMKDDGLEFWFPELAESMETTRIYLDRAKLKPGDSVLDLGAYAGGAAYHFSRAVGAAGRVHAFEPDQRSFDCLAKNIELHALHNVTAHRRGVWSETGRVVFQAEGNMGSAIEDASDRSSDTKEWIDVVSLADFCVERRLERVDFVKMDVEGSEAPILESAGDFIRKYRPSMIIEVHRVKGVRSDLDVARILTSHGYAVEKLDQAGLELPLLYARPG